MSNDETSPSGPIKRFSREDRDLIRRIGTNLRRLINNEDVLDIVPRQDELGILANMVNRVAKELSQARKKDQISRLQLEELLEQQQHIQEELRHTIAELRDSQERQQFLVSAINEISIPLLNLYKGILLLPVIGALDSTRAQAMINALLQRVGEAQAQVVILDITGMPVVDTQVANVILQSAQASALLGARVILCGMTPDVAQVVVNLGINFDHLSPTSDLQDALAMAFGFIGYKVNRR